MNLPRLALLLLAAAGLAAAGPTQKVERLGSLELAYDPALWTVERIDGSRWRVTPLEEEESQTVTIDAAYAGACSEDAMAARAHKQIGFQGRQETVVLPSGLTAHLGFGATGCRNATSAPMPACVTHAGRTHLFETITIGCRGNPYGRAQADELLQGLRPR